MNWTENPRDISVTSLIPSPAGSTDIGQAFWPQVAAARELLARTAELPSSKRELLAILSEYRAALFTFAVENDKPHWGRRVAVLAGRVDVLRLHPAVVVCEMVRVSAGGTAP
jgi:hypothetical protein